uniref:Ig-like domain-containing protein n=1 Tax=Sinocyclocheilus grahami TaxID=75366 RepID=A0A672PEW0_SINGR
MRWLNFTALTVPVIHTLIFTGTNIKPMDSQFTCSVNSRLDQAAWYRQYPAAKPEFLLFVTEYSKFKERFHANLSTTSVPLTIQDVRVSDSAVYYCALRPTGDIHSTFKGVI